MASPYTDAYFDSFLRDFEGPVLSSAIQVAQYMLQQRAIQPYRKSFPIAGTSNRAVYTCSSCVREVDNESSALEVQVQGEELDPYSGKRESRGEPRTFTLGVLRITASRRSRDLPEQYIFNLAREMRGLFTYPHIQLDCHTEHQGFFRKTLTLTREVNGVPVHPDAVLYYTRQWVCPKCPPDCRVHTVPDWIKATNAQFDASVEDCCVRDICSFCKDKRCAHTRATHIERTLQYPATIGHYPRNY